MSTTIALSDAPFENNEIWEELYRALSRKIRNYVRGMSIPSWQGQEADIAEDVVQETVMRIFIYLQQAMRGEKTAPQSITGLAIAIAHNYLRDLRRRECRLIRDIPPSTETTAQTALDQAIENAENEQVFQAVAHDVATFPPKQRQALLTDLATRMHFGKKMSPLEKAFQTAGITLADYRFPKPMNSEEHARQASLCWKAYKRVADSQSARWRYA